MNNKENINTVAEETNNPYVFIDDEPAPKKRRSPIGQKKKMPKKEWPILVKDVSQPRKRPNFSLKPKVPVGESALTASNAKSDVQKILKNLSYINATVSNVNYANTSFSYRQSSKKSQIESNATQTMCCLVESTKVSDTISTIHSNSRYIEYSIRS